MSRPRPPGTTVIELLVAFAVLAVLLTMILAVYRTGATTWTTLDRHSSLARNGLAAVDRISRELEESNYGSLTIGPDRTSLCFLAATRKEDGTFQLDAATGKPVWSHYMLFYLDAASQELRQVEVPLKAGAPEITTPGPIETYDPGDGPKEMTTYVTGGRVVARGLRSCRFEADDRLVTCEMVCAEPSASPSPKPDRASETVTLRSSSWMRN